MHCLPLMSITYRWISDDFGDCDVSANLAMNANFPQDEEAYGPISPAASRKLVIGAGGPDGQHPRLKGMIENLNDGRVRIIAEGKEDKLRWFEEAIETKNTLVQATNMEKAYSQASSEFSGFYRLVGRAETDSRPDQGVEVLKDILVAVKDMNTNLGGKMDAMLDKQDAVLDKRDGICSTSGLLF